MGPTCPDRDVLRRFLAEASPEDEQQWLEEHLEECEACQADLDALDGGDDSWVGRVQDLGRNRSQSAPGLKRIMGVLKDEAEPDPDATGFAEVTPGEILGFLDPADSPGELGKLASYRVLEVLGEGGMGVVLKAVDPALNRTVAIKVLAPQLATSSSARQRFAREARAAAAIRNEHVVAIHSVDEWNGLPYLVMEFIPGASLQQRIDRTGALDLNSILRIGMQAATGLAAAHAQGLVHRDIKPSNILLENCVERVKITDFGLARAVDDASLTQSGVVAGTPLFMAPEQARCESIDHRADLFSLGSVLYAMCTGRSPFRAPTTLGVLRRVCDDIHRPIREVNPEIPVALATVIDRLLAKEPGQRFQTAAEVAERLEQLLARRQQGWTGEDEVVQPPAEPLPVDDVGPVKRPRRRRLLQLAACLLVILSGAFVVAEGTGTTKVIDAIATVLRIKTDDGTLVFKVFDPSMKVQVDGQSVTIHGSGTQSITINPGPHRVDKVDALGNTSTEWIAISRGDKLLVTVGREMDQPSRSITTRGPETISRRSVSQAQQGFRKAQERLSSKNAEVKRLSERVEWARKMREKGYVSAAQLKEEVEHLFTAEAELEKAQGELVASSNGVHKAQVDLARSRHITKPPLKATDSSQVPVQQAMEQLRQAQAARKISRADVARARAELEKAVAQADYQTKNVARLEALLARAAIEQRILDEAMDQRAAALSDRASAEAALKTAEIKLRSAEAEVKEDSRLLELVSAPGPETPERREAILRLHAETALRKAQGERDQAAAEVDRAKAALAGALANHEYRKKQSARMRQLVERKAVEEQLADQAESQASVAAAKVHSAQAELSKAEAQLKEAEQKLRDSKADPNDPTAPDDNASLRDRLDEQLRHETRAVLLLEEIAKWTRAIEKARRLTAHPEKDPALLEYGKRLQEVREQYDSLQEVIRKLLRQQTLEKEYRHK